MNPIYNSFHKFFILLAFHSTVLSAQLTNRVFHQNDTFYSNDTQTVRLNIEIFNYLRNTEYFDIIEKGQTYFGSMFQAHLSYQPGKNILLKAGFQTRQDYGSTSFISIQPVLSICMLSGKWRHNAGMLQGTANYGFIEPMYNIDKAISNRIENGVQSIYRGKRFYFNNFLVWNLPTYRTTKNQEYFTAGFTSNETVIRNDKFYINFPVQATLAHRGGQLNGNPDPIYTRINTAAGAKINFRLSKNVLIRTENYWLHSEDFSPNITQPYKNGNAFWSTLTFKYMQHELMLNYWVGQEWQSPVGTRIYNNYNFYNNYEFVRKRRMIMSRLLLYKEVHKGIILDGRFEPFYDFEYKQIQYGYSFYLRINLGTALMKFKSDPHNQ